MADEHDDGDLFTARDSIWHKQEFQDRITIARGKGWTVCLLMLRGPAGLEEKPVVTLILNFQDREEVYTEPCRLEGDGKSIINETIPPNECSIQTNHDA